MPSDTDNAANNTAAKQHRRWLISRADPAECSLTAMFSRPARRWR